jgi:excisionase family DNA binding protein
MQEEQKSQLLSVNEAAEYLNISKSSVHRLIQQGQIHIVPIVRHRHLVLRDELDDLINRSMRHWKDDQS